MTAALASGHDAHAPSSAMLATVASIHASSSSVSLAASLDAARGKDDDDDAEYEELIPPENFAMIEKGLYRSACCTSMMRQWVCGAAYSALS